MLKIIILENWAEKFWDWIYPFHAISSNFGSASRKVPPPQWPKREKILRLNLSLSSNFQQLWFSWQKSPPPPAAKEGKNYETESIPFMQFQATLVQLAEKTPIGQITWQKFTRGLPPVTKDYLPGMVTPLVVTVYKTWSRNLVSQINWNCARNLLKLNFLNHKC